MDYKVTSWMYITSYIVGLLLQTKQMIERSYYFVYNTTRIKNRIFFLFVCLFFVFF